MNFVSIRLMGGLANQMFQYAAALSLSRHLSAELVVNTWSYKDAPPDRQYQLDIFSIPERTDASRAASDRIPKWLARSSAGRIAMARAAELGIGLNTYREPGFHHDPRFFDLKAPCELRGYFHSPLYFAGCEDIIRARFGSFPPLSNVGAEWASRIAGAERSVAVHVRGGDYKLQAAGQPLRPMSTDYYTKALDIMAKLIDEDFSLFIFTDDIEHARTVLPPRPGSLFVETPRHRPWEDLQLMSLCQHNILANSSFSWWATWLNQSPRKVAIAPRRWFTMEALRDKNTCDLFPDGWLLV